MNRLDSRPFLSFESSSLAGRPIFCSEFIFQILGFEIELKIHFITLKLLLSFVCINVVSMIFIFIRSGVIGI